MPHNDYLPSNDAKYATWLANFHSVAALDPAGLGLTPADITALQDSVAGINSTIADDIAARAAAMTATQSKNDTRAASNTLVRKYARAIQANPNVPDSQRQALGLPVHKRSSRPVVPTTPAALVATPDANGTNILKWKPGGNGPGAVYVVEAATPGNGVWTQVGVATKTRFDHEGVTPGQPLVYRVWAQRGDMQSGASNQAIVYGS